MKTTTVQSASEALKGWWTVFGILATSVTIYNLLNNTFHFNVPQVLAAVLDGYRKVFHFPFRMCELLFSISIHPIIKDAIVLWLIGAAATLRANLKTHNPYDFKAQFSLWRSIMNQEWRRAATYSNFRISIVLGFYHPIWRAVLIIFVWPRLLYMFFRQTPYLYASKDLNVPGRRYIYTSKSRVEPVEREGYRFLFDMRVVFAVQLLTAILTACALAYWSGLDSDALKPRVANEKRNGDNLHFQA